MGRGEGAFQMNLDHRVPLGLGHIDQHAVAQDARIADQHVELAIGADGLVDHGLGLIPVGDVGPVDHRLPAGSDDLGHHLGGGREVGSLAVAGGTQVIDHDFGPLGGQHQAVFPANAASAAGDNGHAAFAQSCHGVLPGLGGLCLAWDQGATDRTETQV